ncbi:MAG: hypothetical protein PHD56_13430 [Anaerostipes sp.]|nr:hypothetical protein [Anaerostipes sp.]
MKKIIMMITMVTMILSFSTLVMAVESPNYKPTTEVDEDYTETTEDEYSKNPNGQSNNSSSSSSDKSSSSSSSSSTSPKTADNRTTTGLVFTALMAATMIIYAGKRVAEEN